MSQDRLIKISGHPPATVCERFEISDEARKTLTSGMTAEQFLKALIDAELYSDAAMFLAHALPKREAVWWACLTARSVGEDQLDPPSAKVLSAAALWVRDPSDDNRRAAMAAAEASGLDKAPSLVGVAAFMSGDTMGPPGGEAVPPPDSMTGTMVGSAVILTAVTPDPLEAADKYRRYLEQGMEIAGGRPATG